jgi:hypothetical protein
MLQFRTVLGPTSVMNKGGPLSVHDNQPCAGPWWTDFHATLILRHAADTRHAACCLSYPGHTSSSSPNQSRICIWHLLSSRPTHPHPWPAQLHRSMDSLSATEATAAMEARAAMEDQGTMRAPRCRSSPADDALPLRTVSSIGRCTPNPDPESAYVPLVISNNRF